MSPDAAAAAAAVATRRLLPRVCIRLQWGPQLLLLPLQPAMTLVVLADLLLLWLEEADLSNVGLGRVDSGVGQRAG